MVSSITLRIDNSTVSLPVVRYAELDDDHPNKTDDIARFSSQSDLSGAPALLLFLHVSRGSRMVVLDEVDAICLRFVSWNILFKILYDILASDDCTAGRLTRQSGFDKIESYVSSSIPYMSGMMEDLEVRFEQRALINSMIVDPSGL